MRPGADAAKAGRDAGHFLDGSAFAELFEAAEFDDLEVGVFDFAFVVEEDVYLGMAFEASRGRYADDFFFYFVFFVFEFRVCHNNQTLLFYNAFQQGFRQCESVESSERVANFFH